MMQIDLMIPCMGEAKMNNFFISMLAGMSFPILFILVCYLNSLWFERERKLILAGKKLPWSHRK